MTIVWRKNDRGGENGYLGKIMIAQYFYNGIDSYNGQYKGGGLLPQSKLHFKTNSIDDIKIAVEDDVREFLNKIGSTINPNS